MASLPQAVRNAGANNVVILEANDHYTRRMKVRARCESADYTERAFIAAIAAAIAIL